MPVVGYVGTRGNAQKWLVPRARRGTWESSGGRVIRSILHSDPLASEIQKQPTRVRKSSGTKGAVKTALGAKPLVPRKTTKRKAKAKARRKAD